MLRRKLLRCFQQGVAVCRIHHSAERWQSLHQCRRRRSKKSSVVPIAKSLAEMGFKIYATQHTADVLNAKRRIRHCTLQVKDSQVSPNIMDYLQERKIDLVINVPMANRSSSFSDILTDGYIIRRQAVEFNVPVITNLQLAAALVEVLKTKGKNGNSIRSLNDTWTTYLGNIGSHYTYFQHIIDSLWRQ